MPNIKSILKISVNLINRNIYRGAAIIRRLSRNRIMAQYYADKITMKMNQLVHNEFIPNPKEHLYIEVTNICNLRCKFCGYSKSLKNKKLAMSNDMFFNIINRATEFGFDTFGLTPIVGEVFVDNHFMDKIQFLENHPKVKNYSFFTNFTLVNQTIIEKLSRLKKIKELYISLYGHDLNSFINITRSNKKTYDKLILNLKNLFKICDNLNFKLSFGLRTSIFFQSLNKCDSELCKIIKNIIRITKSHIQILKSFNTWGGLITQKDVEDLDMIINDPLNFYKRGACSLIFYKNQVMVNGIINACACRDINATLKIGNTNSQSFKHIYSLKNKNYLNLITNQQMGNFNIICKECDFYRSIYKDYEVYQKYNKKHFSLRDFFNYISN